jgi:hypothetical protein
MRPNQKVTEFFEKYRKEYERLNGLSSIAGTFTITQWPKIKMPKYVKEFLLKQELDRCKSCDRLG